MLAHHSSQLLKQIILYAQTSTIFAGICDSSANLCMEPIHSTYLSLPYLHINRIVHKAMLKYQFCTIFCLNIAHSRPPKLQYNRQTGTKT